MKKFISVICLMLITLIVSSQSLEETKMLNRYKALFTVNFIKYIDFGDDGSSEEFNIGVIRNSDVSNNIAKYFKQKKIRNRPVNVKHYTNINDISKCEILYVGKHTSKKNLAALKVKAGDKCLIITETIKIVDGSMINFIIKQQKLKFELDLMAIKGAGLGISSELVSMDNSLSK